MAVKAAGQITLSSVVDVYATYRYYLLQSSTAARPVKPTAFPPPAPWDDTEPGYTEGSTNSLYTVDCTEFSDNTFLYSSVSLSSAYEAAKIAYNKATNAMLHTVVQSTTAPSATTYMWLDISVDPPLLKRYDPETALWVTVNNTAEIVYNLEQNLISSIQETEQNIRAIVAEEYALKDDTESLVSAVSTELELLKDSFTIEFTTFRANIDSILSNTDAEFEEIHKYIRFEDGNIIQGAQGSPFQKTQSATKESYFDNGKEVAYFSNQMLHVTDGEFTHSARFGKFGYVLRENGNLSFKKVVG